MKSKFLVIACLITTFSSCSQTEPEKYKKQMQTYLETEHSIEPDSLTDSFFVMVNLNCLDCLGRNNFENLVSLSDDNLNYIFVGKTHEKRILQIIKILEKRNNVLFDLKTKTKFYELNFSKSILFNIKNFQIQNYIVYHGLNIESIKRDITEIKAKFTD